MDKRSLYSIWAGLFILCAGLGFIPADSAIVRWMLTALAVIFFIPPFLLVYQAGKGKKQDKLTLRLVRNLAALWLCVTALLLVLNVASVLWSEAVGNALYYIMTVVSAPMVCGGSWFLSLFLWAVLLIWPMALLKRKK